MRTILFAALCAVVAFSPAASAEGTCPPLQMLTSVDMKSDSSGRHRYVPIEIGGKQKYLLLDLGAEGSMLSQQIVDELQLPTRQSRMEFYTLTGAKIDRYTSVDIKIGTLKGNLKMMVSPILNDTGDNPDVVGLIGTDVLSNFDLSIDFGTNKLDLLSKQHCDGNVVYWKAPAVTVVPFKAWGVSQIVFDVTLDGKTMKALLDTGAWHSVLKIPVAQRLFKLELGSADTPAAGYLNESDTLKTYRHTFKSLDFNGIAVSNPDIRLIPDTMQKKLSYTPLGSHIEARDDALQAPILVGMNVLRHLHIYIAYGEKKIYVTQAGAQAPATVSDEDDKAPILPPSITRSGDKQKERDPAIKYEGR